MKIKEMYKNLEGKELFEYLHKNKKELIKKMKSTPQFGAAIPFFSEYVSDRETTKAVKALKNEDDIKSLEVEVIANMTNFMDSDNDVILQGAYNKSIQDKGSNIPFLKDHMHQVGAIIADTLSVSTRMINVKSLGIQSDVEESEALIFNGLVKKVYDEKVFNLYKDKLINQHSIGLQYVNLSLALNDEDYEDEYKVWKECYDKIINKSKALENGFFWAIREIKVFENSAVLFGSNSLTPTLSIIENSADIVTESKQIESPQSTQSDKSKVKSYHNFLF